MFTKQFWAGFAIAMMLAVGLAAWSVAKVETEIMFPSKTVYATNDFAMFTGSIVGEDRATMNGTVSGECSRDDGVCKLHSIDQIGHNQVGQIYTDTVTIRQWDDKILRADTKGKNPDQCNYYEISIYIPTSDISYTRYPQKKDGFCKDYEAKVFNWKIDDSYGYTRLTKAAEK